MADKYAVVGTSKPRIDGIEKVTGAATYAADIFLPGMLYGKIKRSPHAHARVISIDTHKARALHGVKAVLTSHDVPRVKHAGLPAPRNSSLVADQYILTEKARFVGDGIAAVAATTEEIAEEALSLIEVKYEILPAVFDIEHALQTDAPRIHGMDSNFVMPSALLNNGDIAQGLVEADLIFEGVYKTGRPAPAYMEPNVCVCQFSPDGNLTIWSSTQGAFMVRGILSEVLDIPLNKIRVIVEHMGGGFGAKQDLYQHEFLCVLLAQKTRRPVKMEYTREESFVGGKSRHPVTIQLKQGVKRDGTITSREVHYMSNTGGYASEGPSITWVGCSYLTSLYRCKENWKIQGDAIYTNVPVAGGYRGFGVMQAFFALECQISEIAEELGIDPVELRLRNAVGQGDPGPSGFPIHGNGLTACLLRGAEEADWHEARKISSGQKAGRYRRGWGVGCALFDSGAHPHLKEQSNITLKMNEDGTVQLLTGASDLGTGAHTVLAQIVAEELGIPFEHISVISGDTEVVPYGYGAFANRTTYVAGNAARKAAIALKSQLFELASIELDVSAEDLTINNCAVTVKGSPERAIPFSKLTGPEAENPARSLVGNVTHSAEVATSFAAHFVEVEVDTETGKIEVMQVVAVHEVGKAINPAAVEGQIEGAIQQGIGHTLTEQLEVDKETGRYLNPSFVDYKMPLAMDMPQIKTVILEEVPDPTAPYGAKGVGQDAILPIGPAIADAVYDAIGVRFQKLPITPEDVIQALAEKST